MLTAIQLYGADELARAWDEAPQVTGAALERFMHAATHYLQGEIQEKTPAAHGTLKASWTNDVERAGNNVIGVVGTPLVYAIPVELGTRPHFPPVEALIDWVKVKLGVDDAHARNVAFLIARKIAKKGTEGAHMVERAVDGAKAELERELAAAVASILEELKPEGSA